MIKPIRTPYSITKYFPGHPRLARTTFVLLIVLYALLLATWTAIFLNKDAMLLKLLQAFIALSVPQLIISFIAIKNYDKWHEVDL